VVKSGQLEKVDILLQINVVVGEILGRLFFGEELSKYEFEGKSIVLALTEMSKEGNEIWFSPLNVLMPWVVSHHLLRKHRKYLRKCDRIRAYCRKLLTEHKNKFDPIKHAKNSNLLDQFLLLNFKEGKEVFTIEAMIEFFVSALSGGKDSTVSLLNMVFYYLAVNPDMKDRIELEFFQYHDRDGPITLDSVNKLEYFDAFVKEVLRVSPPVPGVFFREALDDNFLGDIKIKKGTLVTLCLPMIHNNPRVYEDPEKFKPERWLDKGKKADPFVYLPFSAGQRNCIGQHLAQIEAKMTVISFLKTFNFKLVDGYKLVMDHRAIYGPVDPILLNLERKVYQNNS